MKKLGQINIINDVKILHIWSDLKIWNIPISVGLASIMSTQLTNVYQQSQ